MACDLVHRAWEHWEAAADLRCGQPDDPVKFIARTVIETARRERLRGKYFCEPRKPHSAERVVDETSAFFASDLLDFWCDLAGIDPDYTRERLEAGWCK